VRTVAPCACAASTLHALIALPSRWTVHARIARCRSRLGAGQSEWFLQDNRPAACADRRPR
jgi:hypothetical protein